MSKIFFQRLIAILIIVFTWFIDIPSVFKDVLIIIFSIAIILSTFPIFKSKKI